MSQPGDRPKEYRVSVNTDDLQEAIASLANALYGLVEEALASHEDHEAEECEFEGFARDLLGVLGRHADQFSGNGIRFEGQENGEVVYD